MRHRPKPLDPNRFAENNSEAGHQIALFLWAASDEIQKTYPELRWLFAIPNGGFRDKITASRLRAQGVKSGVPDMCLPIKRGHWSGLFIELKKISKAGSSKIKPSDKQNVWLDFLQSQGYGTIVCYGFEDARQTLIDYINFGNKQWR